jgi:hypothetical protein
MVLFTAALVVELRCGRTTRCTGSFGERLFSLDELGSLPRLFTSGLFLAVAVLAAQAARRSVGPARPWWAAVAGIGGVLALAKLLSAHSVAEGLSPVVTLVVGVVVTAVALGFLARTGRRWGIAAAGAVVLALSCYAGVALGLDAVTSVAAALQDRVGVLGRVAATFVEELGEALAALLVLVTLRRHLPADFRDVSETPRTSVRPDPPDDRPGRPPEDAQVEEQRPVLHVVDVDPHRLLP